MWMFPKIVGFPPKSSILIAFSIINHPFWGTPIFGNTHVFFSVSMLNYQDLINFAKPHGSLGKKANLWITSIAITSLSIIVWNLSLLNPVVSGKWKLYHLQFIMVPHTNRPDEAHLFVHILKNWEARNDNPKKIMPKLGPWLPHLHDFHQWISSSLPYENSFRSAKMCFKGDSRDPQGHGTPLW